MSDAQQERYAAIERHYSQGQWQEVLNGSTALLAELPDQPGDPLRTRLILLQGHTQLYGLGQIAEAAAVYRQVLDSQPEPVLQSIAQQELERCLGQMAASQTETPLPSTTGEAAAGSDFPFTATAVGSAAAGQTVSAMPWLDALGGVDPAAAVAPQGSADQPPWLTTPPLDTKAANPAEVPAEVIDEPEQIDVHQADPQRAEVVDLAPVEAQESLTTPAEELRSNIPDDASESDQDPMDQPMEPSLVSAAEDAELARGLLTVVLR